METNVVSIKGRGSGLIEIRFAKDIAYQQIREGFVEKLKSSKSFLHGSNPKVIIWGRDMNKAQKWDIRNLLSMDYDITNVKFEDELDVDEMELISSSEIDEPNPKIIKKVSDLMQGSFPEQRDAFEAEMEEEKRVRGKKSNIIEGSTFIYNTIRNGQRIEVDGDVTILGDVNDGAEIFATGSIAVLGILRGLVHAGSDGKTDAVVAAMKLTPKQLRIGKKIAVFPDNQEAESAEVARVQDGKIVVSPLNGRNGI